MEDLAKQMQETEVLLRRRKAQVARLVTNGMLDTTELLAITKLERELANMRLVVQARDLTRELPA